MGQEQEITAFDFERMFLGTGDDWVLLLEIAFRTVVIFTFALLLIRFLGKRGQGNLSPFEFVIIIALGSAVGDPMLYPDVPILHAMMVIGLVVALTRLIFKATNVSERFENFIESQPACLILDGVVDVDALRRENIARDELLTALREAGVENLGQVRRTYLEPSGAMSTFMFAPRDQRAGLAIYPACDELHPQIFEEDSTVPETAPYACRACAGIESFAGGTQFRSCRNCGAHEWSLAVPPQKNPG